MEFKKGETLKVTKWVSKTYVGCEDTVDTVEVKGITRRNGVMRLKVWSDLGHGYTIVVNQFEGIYGTIEKVGA
jgi:hypothetical protein